MPQPMLRRALSASAAALALVTASAPARAEEDDLAPHEYEPGRQIAEIEADFDGDGLPDRAELVVGEDRYEGDGAHLIVTFGDGRATQTYRYIAWRGAMYGTQPELSVTARGSLLVKAQNMAIGRFRWESILTIAWRDDAFYVAGYTFGAYDTIDLTNISCDVNLFTGAGLRNGEEIHIAPRRIALADWSEQNAPDACSPEEHMVPGDV